MFNESLIVTTAVSSFNNAALFSPYFFVVGLFTVPLFFMVYFYGRDFISKIGWKGANLESNIGFWTVASLVVWMLIFGGNYAVIRDRMSLLPWGIAVVLFMSSVFLTDRIKQFVWIKKITDNKYKWLLGLFGVVLLVASAVPTWWGILLQLSAVLSGVVIGNRLRNRLSDVSVSTLLLEFVSVLILMQPEYFRFGQLGNLTMVHLLALLCCGFLGMTIFAVKYTNARAKIYDSAYIKLKWLFRILSILALILFVSTESVPVFIGLMICCGVSEMLTVYHRKEKPNDIINQSWAMLLIVFGIMIICPLISMLGIIYLLFVPNKIDFKDFARLL